jgi:acetyl-CoA carboxylase biotin carboxyl carrier protein
MDIKQIKELMATMEKAGLKKMRIKEEKGFELELERHSEPAHFPPSPKHPEPHHHHHFAPSASQPKASAEKSEEAKPGDYISSPMVGTFYSAPSPDDPIYVKVGDTVDEETVVCIIEAMKVMNEVKAGKKGKVVEILVNNADPVEFGTHLFRIV